MVTKVGRLLCAGRVFLHVLFSTAAVEFLAGFSGKKEKRPVKVRSVVGSAPGVTLREGREQHHTLPVAGVLCDVCMWWVFAHRCTPNLYFFSLVQDYPGKWPYL